MEEIKNEIICTEDKCAEDTANEQDTAEATVDCECNCCCSKDTDAAEQDEQDGQDGQDETAEKTEFVIDGEKISDRQTLHAYIAGVMQLPDYYGSNLDALYDCLTEISEPTALKVINCDRLSEQIGEEYYDAFKQMLADAADENEFVEVSFEKL